MFLHDPMAVDTNKLTTRELKELVTLLRISIEMAQEEGRAPEVWAPPNDWKGQNHDNQTTA
jgi:hypothetical protein